MRKLAALFSILVFSVLPAHAQESESPGWQTWTRDGSCFAILYPSEGAIAELNRPLAYLSIKHTPREGQRNSVAIVSGVDDIDGLTGKVDVDGRVFELLMFNGSGYVSTGEREDALIAAMEGGGEMRVSWTNADGMVIQTYQLIGMAQAKRIIDLSCYPES